MTELRELEVIARDSGEVVHRADITGKSDAHTELTGAKLRQQINEEEFYIEDTGAGAVD